MWALLARMVLQNECPLGASMIWPQLRWSRQKNPQSISVDTPPVFSLTPPRFAQTLKMLTTEHFFIIRREQDDFSKPLLPFILSAL